MNSLRTDDIMGARPRVRHMPKNIIREQVMQSYFATNLQTSNPEWNGNMARMQYEQMPQSPIQHMNNDPTSYPFYARNRLSKEAKYIDYDFNRDEPDMSQRSMMRVASENKYNQNPRYYEQIDKPQSRRLDMSVRQNQSMKMELPVTQIDPTSDDKDSKRSQVSSRRSTNSKAIPADEGKRIFRGLGFNIISNHKYQYSFEHKLAPRN